FVPFVPAGPVSSEKRPIRFSAGATYQSDLSEAMAKSVGVPLPRGSAHSVTVPAAYLPTRLFAPSTHHTPVASACTADGAESVASAIRLRPGAAPPFGVISISAPAAAAKRCVPVA